MLSRRAFIKSALASLAAGVACQSEIASDEKILVIGAGISGLAAARTLNDSGYNVKVIEGRNRLGGRTHTSLEWSDVPVDLGASWIHGVGRHPRYGLNPMSELVEAHNIKTKRTNYGNIAMYGIDGKILSPRQMEAVWYRFDELPTIVDAYADDESTISEMLDAYAESNGLSASDRGALEWLAHVYLEDEYAGDVDALSYAAIDEGDAFSGHDEYFPDGYKQIVDILAAGLDIELSQKVDSIEWGEAGIRVTTTTGQTIEADKLVITLPLGVLRSGNISFSPTLPGEKQEAIAALKMGVLNKLYLRFAEPFWQKRPDWLYFFNEESTDWISWVNFYRYTNEPILMAFNAGNFGWQLEEKSDAQLIDEAMEALQHVYGSAVTDPIDTQITRWGIDEFSFGSYSFLPVGATTETRAQLARPIDSKLFFAGEATSIDFPATVHGAYLSGVRAANELMG